MDESEKIKQIINQIVLELLKQNKNQASMKIEKNKKILIIESEKRLLEEFPKEFEDKLAREYELIKKSDDQLNLIIIEELLLTVDQVILTSASFSLQSKIALGLGDCPVNFLLQETLVRGIPTIILSDYLVETSQIQSNSYQRLFIKYQRIIKEYGIIIKKSNELLNGITQKKMVYSR